MQKQIHHMKRPYIFYFTGYDRSNGIRVMMILAQKLTEAGYDVLYYVQDKTNWPTSIPIMQAADKDLRNSAVVVYPEIVAGNPLRVRNVARLVLFFPGRNGGMKRYHKSEMTFAYLPEFLPGADVLTIPWIDVELFNNPGFPREKDYCFVYKKGRWKDPPELRNMPTITMKWPETRQALADILKRTRTLYSFDDASAVLDEALLCGAKVMVVTNDGYREYKKDYARMVSQFPAQFANFVKRTQSSDYRGRMQSKYLFFYWAYAVWRYWIKPRLTPTKH
ncbi:MAG: hypothetical protein II649_02965 [Kiritimatiellae bacterium]|nr:hypothetical protein [Kiritimatiellia bacterium]